jgi:polyhydroxyalkanoate synthesis regulator phasin
MQRYSETTGQIEDEQDFPDPSDEELGLTDMQYEISEISTEYLPKAVPSVDENSSISVLAYLAMGGAILAADEIQSRLNQKRSRVLRSQQEGVLLTHPDDDRDQLRYALIGLMLQAPGSVQKGLSGLGRLANGVFEIISAAVRPVSNSRLAKPLHTQFETLVQRGEQIVAEWVVSRDMVQDTAEDVVDDLVELLANRPELRELIQQQSIGLAQEFSGELQSRSAAADSLLERVAYRILPFAKRDITPTLEVPDLPEDER